MVPKKILFVFGTRPEAIKLAPVILAFKKAPQSFVVKICITAQHREMLDQVLDFFDIKPDFDLDIMTHNQNLSQLSASILTGIKQVLDIEKPDVVLVHGDTTTTFVASLSCFYEKIKVGHVESGLRTFNKFSPYPEEMNRLLTGRLADFHFAPTKIAKDNLLNESVCEKNILITGNTVIDALCYTVKKMSTIDSVDKVIPELNGKNLDQKKIILVTGHRRENHGLAFENICKGLKSIASEHQDCCIIFPVHPNPNVRKIVFRELQSIENIFLIEPLNYQQFIWLMNKAYLIITDSGGIQEEAPTLKKPVLVMRDTTERPEALDLGFIKLVGTDPEVMKKEALTLLTNSNAYEAMQATFNPYGDGIASKRIVEFLEERL